MVETLPSASVENEKKKYGGQETSTLGKLDFKKRSTYHVAIAYNIYFGRLK
jgi:hypothetical protein